MSNDPRPTKTVVVTIDGQRWEMTPLDKLTFPETKELKRVSDGMSLKEVGEGIEGIDGDAWFAWMYVSIRRKCPTLTVAELEAAIGDTPVGAIVEAAETVAPEGADADPPAPASANDALEQQNDNGSGEKTLPHSTLETVGHRT